MISEIIRSGVRAKIIRQIAPKFTRSCMNLYPMKITVKLINLPSRLLCVYRDQLATESWPKGVAAKCDVPTRADGQMSELLLPHVRLGYQSTSCNRGADFSTERL